MKVYFKQNYGLLFANQKTKITDINKKANILMNSIMDNELTEKTHVHDDLVDKECLVNAKLNLEQAIMWATKAYSNINTNNVTIPNENETNDEEILHEE